MKITHRENKSTTSTRHLALAVLMCLICCLGCGPKAEVVDPEPGPNQALRENLDFNVIKHLNTDTTFVAVLKRSPDMPREQLETLAKKLREQLSEQHSLADKELLLTLSNEQGPAPFTIVVKSDGSVEFREQP